MIYEQRLNFVFVLNLSCTT
uniref:Uncharacterized protein n=1 Tax=Arundo donax TaxID=35708 RepID=A0A0A9A1X2_ARUDO